MFTIDNENSFRINEVKRIINKEIITEWEIFEKDGIFPIHICNNIVEVKDFINNYEN